MGGPLCCGGGGGFVLVLFLCSRAPNAGGALGRIMLSGQADREAAPTER